MKHFQAPWTEQYFYCLQFWHDLTGGLTRPQISSLRLFDVIGYGLWGNRPKAIGLRAGCPTWLNILRVQVIWQQQQ